MDDKKSKIGDDPTPQLPKPRLFAPAGVSKRAPGQVSQIVSPGASSKARKAPSVSSLGDAGRQGLVAVAPSVAETQRGSARAPSNSKELKKLMRKGVHIGAKPSSNKKTLRRLAAKAKRASVKPDMMARSSTVEHRAVNSGVASSKPAASAKKRGRPSTGAAKSAKERMAEMRRRRREES